MKPSFGQYEIRDELGEGKLGRVYLARDPRQDREVAVKLLFEDAFSGQRDIKRCTKDAYIVGEINHPNVGDIYEVGRTATSLYVVSEYVKGETLRERLRSSPLSLRESLHIAIQIGTALSEAHRRGIIHRDIKPENVMLLPTGIVKVVDFGLARLSGPSAERGGYTAHIGAAENLLSRIAYLSPEEIRGRSIDRRSDLWGLGALLYEMISGQAPFAAGSTSNLEYSILKGEPSPLRTAPIDVQRIIDKAMSKSRWHRYQTAREMIQDLEEVRERMTFGSLPESVSRSERRAKKGIIHRIAERLTGGVVGIRPPTYGVAPIAVESEIHAAPDDALDTPDRPASESGAAVGRAADRDPDVGGGHPSDPGSGRSHDSEEPAESDPNADEGTLYANVWIEDSDRIPVATPVCLLSQSNYSLLFGVETEIRSDASSTSEFREPPELRDAVSTELEIQVTCELLTNESGRESRGVKYRAGYGFSPEAFSLKTRGPGNFFATVRLFYRRTILFRERIKFEVANSEEFASRTATPVASESLLENQQ